MERHPIAAVRLLSTGCGVAQAVGGAASGYRVPMQFHVETHYVDGKTGQTTELPKIDSIEEAQEIIRASDSKRALPSEGQ
jgi:hypothetical protein